MSRRTRSTPFVVSWFLFLASVLPAQAHPIVPGFERFFTDAKADAARGGRLLLGELNCISCHHADAAQAENVGKKQAPILDGIGQRVHRGFLRRYLNDPNAVKPGTTMPNLLAGLPEKERKEHVDALVHFLASTGASPVQGRLDQKLTGSGKDLYHRVGCVACHGPRDAMGQPVSDPLPTSVPLGDLSAKYTFPTLIAFLLDPHKVRPSGRMPMTLDPKDIPAVAQYLTQGQEYNPPVANLAYSYYEGSWDKLPDFDKLKAKTSGKANGFDLSVAQRNDNMAIRFEGYLRIDRDGQYNFHLTSDDGSKLFIADQLLIDNDGIHPPSTKVGRAFLKQGVHKFVAAVFNGGGGVELNVDIQGSGLSRQSVVPMLFPTPDGKLPAPTKPKKDDEENFIVEPELVEKGRGLFASLGCASCHQLTGGGKPIESKLIALGLAKLKPEAGCLSAKVEERLPQYHLSGVQRTALTAALKSLTGSPAKPMVPRDVIANTLLAFNCYACHERDKIGGVEGGRDKFFVTTQQEMGDEGRLPPHLNGVGGKLTSGWLKTLLANGSKDRPYMLTRMPKFGEAAVGKLAAAFETVDAVEPMKPIEIKDTVGHIKAAGRLLVGGQAFGCIKCHTFAGNKAEGVQGIELAILTQRLRPDWFHRYLRDPLAYRPGTRMPSPFFMGQSLLKTVLDGDANKQSEAIWQFLSDGTKAAIPDGVAKSLIPLVPEKEAIVYRNFIDGGGTRAIAVGYPEKAHLSFDANDLRLALVWQGAFIDASKHWNDRGAGNQPPLGDNVIHLPAGAAFARLTKPDDAWPTSKPRELDYHFLGYRLTKDQRPTFRYRVGAVEIEDFPNAVASQPHSSVRRTVTLTTKEPPDNLYFRAMVADKIEPLGDGWFRIAGEWKMRLTGDAKVRDSGGKKELLVPVKFADGKATITQEFVW